MASGLVKSESEWDAGSLILSQREKEGPTDTTTSTTAVAKLPTTSFPVLPKISGDLILETYTHKSLRIMGSSISDQFPDNERLSKVGEMAIQLAVTNYLYHKVPVIEANGMPGERCSILSDENYELWVNHYNLRKQLRFTSSLDIYTPQETRTLLNAYVGAVYEQHGMRAVGTWILRLIDPDQLPVNPDDSTPSTLPPQKEVFRQFKQSNQRDVKRVKSEGAVVGIPDSSSSIAATPAPPDLQPPPLPPSVFPPGAGVYSSPPVNFLPAAVQQQQPGANSPILPALPSGGIHYLPKFNEFCAKQKFDYEYLAENHGSAHAPKWIVKCMVTGIHKGTGQGSTKQIAKEEAAKHAFFAMGWIG